MGDVTQWMKKENTRDEKSCVFSFSKLLFFPG